MDSKNSMAEFNFKGVWVPAKVFTDDRLTHADKFLFALIHILSNQRGCFATRETLSGYMCQSVRNTQYSISRLHSLGYVRKDPDGTLWDIVSASLEGEENFMAPMKKSSDEPCKKLHPDSNKDGNKVSKRVQPDLSIDFLRANMATSHAWDQWIEYRRSRGWTVSNEYQNRWDKAFREQGWSISQIAEATSQSMLNGWQGLFRPKGGIAATKPKSDTDHAAGF
jgi:hypothetical protein